MTGGGLKIEVNGFWRAIVKHACLSVAAAELGLAG